MTLYEAVKNTVTTLQAAERYGLKVGRGGMCKCPFHNDRNPSMKVDKRFHCFGCQADGDVIDFTLLTKDEANALAAGMEAMRDQAVEKISAAFGLKPIVKPELEIVDLSRRQSCRKNGMER